MIFHFIPSNPPETLFNNSPRNFSREEPKSSRNNKLYLIYLSLTKSQICCCFPHENERKSFNQKIYPSAIYRVEESYKVILKILKVYVYKISSIQCLFINITLINSLLVLVVVQKSLRRLLSAKSF